MGEGAHGRHGGNLRQLARAAGRPEAEILDFSANINPLGPPEWLRPLIASKLHSLVHYPDPDCSGLIQAVCARYGVTGGEVLAANGSTEILHLLPRAAGSARAVIPVPAYADYASTAEGAGIPIEKIVLSEAGGFALDLPLLESLLKKGDLVHLGRPNNPTGLVCQGEELRSIISLHPSTLFVIDEAFADFVAGIDRFTRNRPPNVLVLLSLTKFFAIPGLRLGCALADPTLISALGRLAPCWSVNALAQAVGERALQDEEYASRTRRYVRERREELSRDLQSLPGLTVYPGQANFLLVRIDRRDLDAPALSRRLLERGVAIRVCRNFDGLDGRFFRLAVRTGEENARLLQGLRAVLGLSLGKSPPKKKPAVMFQGTSSHAGKSVLSAAFCRILLQDGFRVAPFKAQNMSLNSYVTRDGGEMGRAQVVQAQACRLEPDVRMNPVLLKPNSDTGAQVIVLGQPVGNMEVREYLSYKEKAREAARQAFDSLAAEYDVIVLEGAGSPAEVNLKSHDIANMAAALQARAPVLLVGDIDRGGVFASFIGTMEVLAEWERRLIAGFVINRFRGQTDLLEEAIAYTERHAGRPTFGVVPFVPDLGLPEEDSVGFKEGRWGGPAGNGARLEIALIDLPHISNFTDFDSLLLEPDVHLYPVRSPRDLENAPDALILPGSKNVIGDLEHLVRTGLDRRIIDLAGGGRTEVIGLCGGFQILGRQIADPWAVESSGRSRKALGLLPVSTTLAREKTLARVTGRHLDSGLAVKGYEIHHGRTDGAGIVPLLRREDGELIGGRSADSLLWGTYLHGVFDADEFRRWFLDRMRARRGWPPAGKILARYDLEPAFERLAGVVRKNLRVNEIYRLMGLR